jgi:hypothetical protein
MAIDINIPSQVKNYANLAGFPVTGSLKTIYIAEDTNKTYRWTGSAYVEISASQAAAWGTITGTLSSQTDLQTALNGKVPTTRTLTINGTTQDLSADRTFTISTGITIGTTAITSGTVGRVLFEGAGNVVQESANLFWDNTNGRLGIGTSSPTTPINIVSSTNAALFVKIQNNNSGALATTGYEMQSNTAYGSIFATSSNYTPYGVLGASQIGFYTSNTFAIALDSSSADFKIGVGTSAVERFRIKGNTGNVLINTTTDAGFKLDVNGTARVNTLTIGLGGGQLAQNTAIGYQALAVNTTGSTLVALGYQSLVYNTTGNNNTAIGNQTLFSNTTGNNNTAIGRNAGYLNTTGSQNIVIGAFSGTGNFSNTTILGYNDTATADNQMRFGSAQTNNGAVTTEVNASTQVWNVIINGVARKILLA